MFVDVVSLVVCLPTGTPTPTRTPTPTSLPTVTPLPTNTPTPTTIPTPVTPSPIPPNCVDILANGDFEWNGAWLIGDTPLRAFYAGPPPAPASGSRMMALGAILPGAPTNVPSFSSIQQSVTLPVTAQTAQIRFFYYPISNAAAGGFNRQELILLDPLKYGETIQTLWRVTENANRWVYLEIDLTRYLGRTVTIYFNARNAGDGTRTAMYLDQVQVLTCNGAGIMPLDEAMGDWKQMAPAEDYFYPTAGPPPVALPPQTVVPPGVSAPAVVNQPTVIRVGEQPAPLPEVTPIGTPTRIPEPDETPRRELGSALADLPANPWLIIIVISVIVLVAVVAALLVFREK